MNIGDVNGYDESSLGDGTGFSLAWSSMTNLDANDSNDGSQAHEVDTMLRKYYHCYCDVDGILGRPSILWI